jgi:Zn-dependent protease with chaperone function
VSDIVSTRYENISSKAYEHPADRAATAALKAIPGLDSVVRKLIELRYERAFRQNMMASSVKLGPEQLPAIWSSWQGVESTLDLSQSHDLYVTSSPVANAAAVGSEKPMVVVHSAAVSILDEQELRTVLAHEAGHILSDHVLYQTALQILLRLAPLGRAPTSLTGLPTIAIRSALLEWFRAAELSADRAATLVNRDPVVTSRTLLVLAGGLPSKQLNVDAFLKQAQEYGDWEPGWDRISRMLRELNYTHSSPVQRVSQLMEWVRSGDYDRIVGGDYRRRDEKVDAGAEADAAFQHYQGRFRQIFEEAGDGVGKVGDRMSEWAQKLRL